MTGCENANPVSSENTKDVIFPYPGSSPDPLTSGMAVAKIHVMPVDPSELDIPVATETYTCLWTSGTYYETGTWDWEDVDLTFTVSSNGVLEIETINALCGYPVGHYTTAAAFYYPTTENKALNYDLFGTVLWDLPQWGPWCWMLIADWTWEGLPHSHGVSVQVDWASAYAIGSSIPPIDGACGWPLVGNPPPAFTVHGL
jgi:hypothetical protein